MTEEMKAEEQIIAEFEYDDLYQIQWKFIRPILIAERTASIHLRQQVTALEQKVLELEKDFQNLHRLICEASGYGHDEVDWKRDQASLAEFIRTQKSELTTLRSNLQEAGITRPEELKETLARYQGMVSKLRDFGWPTAAAEGVLSRLTAPKEGE